MKCFAKKNSLLFITLFVLLTIFPLLSYAQEGPPTSITPIPGQTTAGSPGEYILNIFTYGLGFGALLAMVMIVIGSIQYTLSEAISSKQDAKDRILKAIWGLVLLLAATLILFTINPQLTELTNPYLEPVSIGPESTPLSKSCIGGGGAPFTGNPDLYCGVPGFGCGPIGFGGVCQENCECSVADDQTIEISDAPFTGSCGDGIIQTPNKHGVNEVCEQPFAGGKLCTASDGGIGVCSSDCKICSIPPESSGI